MRSQNMRFAEVAHLAHVYCQLLRYWIPHTVRSLTAAHSDCALHRGCAFSALVLLSNELLVLYIGSAGLVRCAIGLCASLRMRI